MTTRDERHRRHAQRLRGLGVALAAEVLARGGSLDWYPDLTAEERSEAEEQSKRFWPCRMVEVQRRVRQTRSEARRVDSLASTD